MNFAFDKQVAPVIDIFPDLCGVPYRRDTIRNKMKLLRRLGYERVYLVDAPPNCGMFSNPWLDLLAPNNKAGNYAVESLLAIGDPVFEHIREAHRLGMEAIVVMKPYEGGGGYTLPHGERPAFSNRTLTCIGGERTGFEPFLAENPHLRVKRRPIPDYDRLMKLPVTRLKMAFALDEVIERTGPGRQLVHARLSDEAVADWPMSKRIRLWISADNGVFEEYRGKFEVEESIVLRTLTDANGLPLGSGPQRCREVTVGGLNIGPDTPYVAVTIDVTSEPGAMPGSIDAAAAPVAAEARRHLLTVPYSMIRLFSGGEELPATVTPYVRGRIEDALSEGDNAKGVAAAHGKAEAGAEPGPGADAACKRRGQSGGFVAAGAQQSQPGEFIAAMPIHGAHAPEAGEAFGSAGFEFEWYGAGMWDAGWTDSRVYGIARGKLQYMKGTLCEAYPEVRRYWLERIDKLLDMGADGIDLRLQNHSGMVSDYASYGYNEPLVEAYKRKHGVDILAEKADPLALMRIRGDFYVQFAEEAAALIRSRGAKLLVHVRESLARPRLSSEFGELGFWAMPKISPDWERLVELADEVTLKDYNWGSYSSGQAAEIKDRVAALDKPLWVHAYIAQGNDINEAFVAELGRDRRVTGLLLYETGHNPYRNNAWIGIIEAKANGEAVYHEEIVDKLRRLGLTRE